MKIIRPVCMNRFILILGLLASPLLSKEKSVEEWKAILQKDYNGAKSLNLDKKSDAGFFLDVNIHIVCSDDNELEKVKMFFQNLHYLIFKYNKKVTLANFTVTFSKDLIDGTVEKVAKSIDPLIKGGVLSGKKLPLIEESLNNKSVKSVKKLIFWINSLKEQK